MACAIEPHDVVAIVAVGRVNNIIDTSISFDLPANLGSVNQRLFPNSWSVTC